MSSGFNKAATSAPCASA